MSLTEKIGIPMAAVKSSNVARIGYDDGTQRFAVEFNRTPGVYVYEGVPKKTADAVFDSGSTGSAVQQHIVRGGFKFAHLKDAE